MGRGRVALRSADRAQEPLVEMNFAGHELDLRRLMSVSVSPSRCWPT